MTNADKEISASMASNTVSNDQKMDAGNPAPDGLINTVEAPEPQTAPKQSHRRLVPIYIASSLSVLWLAAAGYYTATSNLLSSSASLSVIDMGSLFAGLFTPLALIWLIMLAFQRSDPMLEHRLAISQNLHKALSPVEQAEQRYHQLHSSLEKELVNIEAVADLAADRIGNLEGRFQEQISNLFSATADAEARTSSIRETIERERNSVTDLTEAMEDRFAALEETLTTITEKLTSAEHKAISAAQSATEHSEKQMTLLDHQASDFETRLHAAGTSLTDKAGAVENLSMDMELRLQTIQDRLSGSIDKLRGDVASLESQSAELSDHMRTQGHVLTELAELAAKESHKIEDTLKSHVNEVRTAAEDALEKTDTVSNMFADRAQAMSDKVIDTVAKAKSLLEEAGSALDQHCEEALSSSSELNARAMAQTQETASAVREHAEQINQLLVETLDRARDRLDETAQGISSHAESAENLTQQAAERSLAHMRQFQASLEDEIQNLAAKAKTAEEAMQQSASNIADSGDSLIDKSNTIAQALQQADDTAQKRSALIADTLDASQEKLNALEQELDTQRTTMVAQTEEAANKVIEASELFRNQTQSMEQAASVSESSLKLSSQQILNEQEKIESMLKRSSEAMTEEMTLLNNANESLSQNLDDTQIKLKGAAARFREEREKLVQDSQKMLDQMGSASEEMVEQVEGLTASSSAAAAKLENATQALKDETNTVRDQIDAAVGNASSHLRQEVEQMGNKAAEKITVMQEEMQMTIARLLKDYQEAAENAEKESALLSARIGNEADKVAERAEQFVLKTAEIEKRIAKNTKNDFARTSQMLLESLQSLSIDIHKLLADDVPDTVWQAYLKGDRSIFSRSTIKMGSRKTRSLIADKFAKDQEFRENVSRFMRDFEGLMERAMHGDKGNTLSVTLISSDMGKLYVLLAQSMKKLS